MGNSLLERELFRSGRSPILSDSAKEHYECALTTNVNNSNSTSSFGVNECTSAAFLDNKTVNHHTGTTKVLLSHTGIDLITRPFFVHQE